MVHREHGYTYVLDLSIGDYEQCVKVCKNMAVGGELMNHVFVQQTTKLSEHIKVTHGRRHTLPVYTAALQL